jgi:hypothetical protein
MAKRKKPTPGKAAPHTDATPEPVVLIVRRGALRRFDILKRKTADLPVEVSWDRRVGNPRPSGQNDRRAKTDQRQKPPFTWDTADFVVVDPRRGRKRTKK